MLEREFEEGNGIRERGKGGKIMNNEKLLEKIRALEIICRGLIERVKKLEQAQTYYPTEEEIKNIKIGGTD